MDFIINAFRPGNRRPHQEIARRPGAITNTTATAEIIIKEGTLSSDAKCNTPADLISAGWSRP
jgi:hypothetical protein